MSFWTRPADVPFPSVWHRFERTSPDGTVRKFYVQDATEEMDVFLIDHMQKFFARDEVLCKAAGAADDPASMRSMGELWRMLLKQRCALVCFEEDPDEPGKPAYFAGCNMTYVSTKDDPQIVQNPEEAWHSVLLIYIHLMQSMDVFDVLKMDKCLATFGLSVVPNFRRMGIGTELLKARNGLCKALDVPVTMSTFTSHISQAAAVSAGFEELARIDYENLTRDIPECHFPYEIASNCMKLMYKRIE